MLLITTSHKQTERTGASLLLCSCDFAFVCEQVCPCVIFLNSDISGNYLFKALVNLFGQVFLDFVVFSTLNQLVYVR